MEENNKKSIGNLFNKVKDSATNKAKELGDAANEKIKSVDVEGITNKVLDGAKKSTDKFKEKTDFVDWDKVEDKTKKGLTTVVSKANVVTSKAAEVAIDSAVKVIEKSGGDIKVNDIVNLASKIPGVKVDKKEFLSKALESKLDKETIDKVVNGEDLNNYLSNEDIDAIANAVIDEEGEMVSKLYKALKTATSMGVAAAGPANLIQIYGYMIKCSQELLYLYGLKEINLKDSDTKESALNTLTMCIATMYGVEDADKSITEIVKSNGETAKDLGNINELLSRVVPKIKVIIQEEIKKSFTIEMPTIGKKEEKEDTSPAAKFKPNCIKLLEAIKQAK